MNNRLLSLLGLARRCGRIAAGYDVAAGAVAEGISSLILVSGDIAQRTEKNISRVAEQYQVTVIKIGETMAEIGRAIGAAPTGVISINEAGFAKKARQIVRDYEEA